MKTPQSNAFGFCLAHWPTTREEAFLAKFEQNGTRRPIRDQYVVEAKTGEEIGSCLEVRRETCSGT
jgi:hypothetical protein